MPLFVLTPASLVHTALFTGYYTYLDANAARLRFATGLMIGEGGEGSLRLPTNATTSNSSVAAGKAPPSDAIKNEVKKVEQEDALKLAVRAQANFAEHVPLAFMSVFIAELNGAPTWLVHTLYSTLFVARVLHASFGIIPSDSGAALGRPVGFYTTGLVTLFAGLYNLRLGWPALKTFLNLN